DHRRDDPLRDRDGGAGEAEDPRRAALTDGIPDMLGDVVFALEEAEPAPPVGDLVDVVGELVDEAVHLGDELWDKEGADGLDHDQDDEKRQPAGEAAIGDAVALKPIDGR